MVSGVWMGQAEKPMKVASNMTFGDLKEQFLVEHGHKDLLHFDDLVVIVNGSPTLYHDDTLLGHEVKKVRFESKKWEDIKQAKRAISTCFEGDPSYPEVKALVAHLSKFVESKLPGFPPALERHYQQQQVYTAAIILNYSKR